MLYTERYEWRIGLKRFTITRECVCVQPRFARAVCSYLIGEREKGRILFEQTSYIPSGLGLRSGMKVRRRMVLLCHSVFHLVSAQHATLVSDLEKSFKSSNRSRHKWVSQFELLMSSIKRGQEPFVNYVFRPLSSASLRQYGSFAA